MKRSHMSEIVLYNLSKCVSAFDQKIYEIVPAKYILPSLYFEMMQHVLKWQYRRFCRKKSVSQALSTFYIVYFRYYYNYDL